MSEGLPRGWTEAALGDVCLAVPNVRPQDEPNKEFTYIDIGGIDSETNRITNVKSVLGRRAPSRAKQAVQKGDVLFSTVRTYLRKIALIEHDYAEPLASTGFVVLRAAEGVLPEFLFLQVLSESFCAPLDRLQTGTSYPAVRNRDVLAQRIVLPPILEQQRIVNKLALSFSAISKGHTAAARARARLEQLRVSVLDAAISGELTREWRATLRDTVGESTSATLKGLLQERQDRSGTAGAKRRTEPLEAPSTYDELPGELPESWTYASVDQLVWAAGYGTSVKCTYEARGPAVVRIPNIRDRVVDFSDLKFATDARLISPPDLIAPGDLLVIRTNGSEEIIGRAAVINTTTPTPSGFASYLIRLRLVGDSTLWSWVSLVWASGLFRRNLRRAAKTTAGQYNISLGSILRLSVPFPPKREQEELVSRVERKLAAATQLAGRIDEQLTRARQMRQLLLRDAMAGILVTQDESDEPALTILKRAKKQKEALAVERTTTVLHRSKREKAMKDEPLTPTTLTAAFERLGRSADARRLFDEAGCKADEVVHFYETLRATPEVRSSFEQAVSPASDGLQPRPSASPPQAVTAGQFRLSELWLDKFKNLSNYTVRFDPSHGLDVVLGWNGTGKSNLFEALLIIFRDLHEWTERNKWPTSPVSGYRLKYEINRRSIEVVWTPSQMKRPVVTSVNLIDGSPEGLPVPVPRTQVPLPRFVFGYYSGPTNRLAEHFLPMKQAHYKRLREADSDDAETLASLLEQRRFFCAETHHAKYVLLAFSHREDPQISEFLRTRLRIVGFESALFVIRKPRWAKSNSPRDFWGAKGVMRRVLERLSRYAIAPMIVEQTVSNGYQSTTEEHYYFFLPDLKSLHAFAAEYRDARTFFLALESTDFSELIHDVKIQVRVKSTESEQVSITFHQLSEGEQQLLMVLGLMRFTKSHQSLVLLDEPDTHLNPHWSVDYVKDLGRVMSDSDDAAPEQQSSQILMASHDPLVIASLVKEQIHLLVRDRQSGVCRWQPAGVNPRGLGFTGILTSEMFGFRSDLDEETLTDLDNKVRLVAQESLTESDQVLLKDIDARLASTGFAKAFSDPYYAAFMRAWGRRHSELMAGQRFLNAEERVEVDRIANEVLKEAIAAVEKEIVS